MAMMVPKTQDLIMEVITSQPDTARVHESRMMLALTSYTACASRQLHAMPAAHPRKPVSAAAAAYALQRPVQAQDEPVPGTASKHKVYAAVAEFI